MLGEPPCSPSRPRRCSKSAGTGPRSLDEAVKFGYPCPSRVGLLSVPFARQVRPTCMTTARTEACRATTGSSWPGSSGPGSFCNAVSSRSLAYGQTSIQNGIRTLCQGATRARLGRRRWLPGAATPSAHPFLALPAATPAGPNGCAFDCARHGSGRKARSAVVEAPLFDSVPLAPHCSKVVRPEQCGRGCAPLAPPGELSGPLPRTISQAVISIGQRYGSCAKSRRTFFPVSDSIVCTSPELELQCNSNIEGRGADRPTTEKHKVKSTENR